jgi:hypothetical protein
VSPLFNPVWLFSVSKPVLIEKRFYDVITVKYDRLNMPSSKHGLQKIISTTVKTAESLYGSQGKYFEGHSIIATKWDTNKKKKVWNVLITPHALEISHICYQTTICTWFM